MEPTVQALSVKNLRAISMPKKLKLVPITILVGKNSAGKSTFARLFPLLRQSCEAKTRAPILWFGERIDFGSFNEALQRGRSGSEIEFAFDINIPRSLLRHRSISNTDSEDFAAEVKISVKNSGNAKSYAPKIQITALGFTTTIKITELNNIESVTCGKAAWKPKVTDFTDVVYQAILPTLTIMRDRDSSEKQGVFEEIFPFIDEIQERLVGLETPLKDRLVSAISSAPLFQRGTLLDSLFQRMRYHLSETSNENIQFIVTAVAELEELVFTSKVNDLLVAVDNALRSYFTGVKYIEPLRATAQRYYRKQELALDEIDSKGENVAMYLDNLGPWQLEEFNKWTLKSFGFSVRTHSEGGHVAIMVREEGSLVESNLADIGFGFSQMLPVIIQVWASPRRPNRGKRTSCLVIEQPELHLHPALQAKLADVFAASATVHRSQQLIVETHSSQLINRLGQLISEGQLRSEDVQIIVFEKDQSNTSRISHAGFDTDGFLKNWPIGFFEPEM